MSLLVSTDVDLHRTIIILVDLPTHVIAGIYPMQSLYGLGLVFVLILTLSLIHI